MNRLKELRESRGLTQTDLGKILNASQNTVSNWENGNRRIDNERLLKISEYFGVPVGYILCADESSASSKSVTLDPRLADLLTGLAPDDIEKALSYIEWLKSQQK